MAGPRWGTLGLAAAAVVAMTLGVGYWIGRRTAPAATEGSRAASPRPVEHPQPISAPAATPPARAATPAAAIEQAVAQERWAQARRLCQQFLQDHPDSPAAAQVQQRLWESNLQLLRRPSAEATPPFYTTYTIQLGDTLGRIARRHKTTVELLQTANRLTGDTILVGRTIRVPTATFSVIVDKSQNTLTLKASEEILKTYTVSTGKDDQTPVGTFTIINKLVDPPWYTAQGVIPAGSPENILGTRWLGFSKPGYGIHGTTDPTSIGQPVTAGCVRMRNTEVEELYALLPLGTDVTIVD